MLGMGVGVDYALFMVARFREELAAGLDRGEAARRTAATAGKAIVFFGAMTRALPRVIALVLLITFVVLVILRVGGTGAPAWLPRWLPKLDVQH